jgi:peptidoglycan hydrolase-like protein with peptidoglycan-binding domain
MRTLRANATGDDVKAWQGFLKTQGLFDGTIDGAFGVTTLASTKAFQQAHALLGDGLVGNKTLGQAMQLGLVIATDDPPLPGGQISLRDAWTAPEPPAGSDLFTIQDPRVITNHQAGVLPCPRNPPPPVGWTYWRGPVPASLNELAAQIENDPARFPMGSFVQAIRSGNRVAARVEWHDFQGKSGAHGCFRGTNLLRPLAIV